MKRFIEGEDRTQSTLFPERLDDYIGEDNPVRVIDVFVDELNLRKLGFERVEPHSTGRPAYHPAMLLKLYIYGYLNRVPGSRRLERETQRNVEVMWLTRRLMPDHKTMSYCQIWCSGAESSGGLIDVCYFDSVFEFHSGVHLREISESA